MFAHVIDRHFKISPAEGSGIINDGAISAAVYGGGAAKGIIGPAIQAVGRDWKVKKCVRDLLVPYAHICVGTRSGIGAVRETIIAVVKIAARITE